VSFHFLNNAFLLDLPLETAKGALNGFSLKNPDFCQIVPPCDLRSSREYGCRLCQKQRVFSQMPGGDLIIYPDRQLTSFRFKLLNRHLSASVDVALSPLLREVMNSRTSSIEEKTLSLLRELQG